MDQPWCGIPNKFRGIRVSFGELVPPLRCRAYLPFNFHVAPSLKRHRRWISTRRLMLIIGTQDMTTHQVQHPAGPRALRTRSMRLSHCTDATAREEQVLNNDHDGLRERKVQYGSATVVSSVSTRDQPRETCCRYLRMCELYHHNLGVTHAVHHPSSAVNQYLGSRRIMSTKHSTLDVGAFARQLEAARSLFHIQSNGSEGSPARFFCRCLCAVAAADQSCDEIEGRVSVSVQCGDFSA